MSVRFRPSAMVALASAGALASLLSACDVVNWPTDPLDRDRVSGPWRVTARAISSSCGSIGNEPFEMTVIQNGEILQFVVPIQGFGSVRYDGWLDRSGDFEVGHRTVLASRGLEDRATVDGRFGSLTPELERVLDTFSRLSREQTMQALVEFSNRFPELPERFAALAASEEHKVHECMTPVALFSEVDDGRIRFYADVPRNAPTIRALLTILMSGLNDHPVEDVLAIPPDFVSRLMRNVGLSTRERGLQAILARMKRHAREAIAA